MATDSATTMRIIDNHASQRLAGPWARYFARCLDLVIFTLPSIIIATMLADHLFDLHHLAALGHIGFFTIPTALIAVVASAFLAVALAAIMAQFGATPGKRLFAIRVQSLTTNAGFLFYLRRELFLQFVGLASYIPWGGFLVVLVFDFFQYRRVKVGRAAVYDVERAQVFGIRISRTRGLLAALALVLLVAISGLIYFHIMENYPEARELFLHLPSQVAPDVTSGLGQAGT